MHGHLVGTLLEIWLQCRCYTSGTGMKFQGSMLEPLELHPSSCPPPRISTQHRSLIYWSPCPHANPVSQQLP